MNDFLRLLRSASAPASVGRRARALLVLLVLAGASAARALPVLALLPATGDGAREQRTKLDAAIRKAAVADGGYALQSARETTDQIAFMAEQGIICTSSDVPCLQRLGILCGAQFLLVPEASGERELDVSMMLLGVEDGVGVVRTVTGSVNLANATAKKLTLQALHGGDDGDPVNDPVPVRDPLAPDPASVADNKGDPLDETKLNQMQFAGAAVASVGGGLGALALLGALSCEAIFWTGTGSADSRKNLVAPLGSVLWIGTVVGAAAAATGAGIFLAGAPAADDGGVASLE